MFLRGARVFDGVTVAVSWESDSVGYEGVAARPAPRLAPERDADGDGPEFERVSVASDTEEVLDGGGGGVGPVSVSERECDASERERECVRVGAVVLLCSDEAVAVRDSLRLTERDGDSDCVTL